MQQITELLQDAGYSDFRDARGALGLTQRQAGGKFTSNEADELIERLEAAAEVARATGEPAPAEPAPPVAQRQSGADKALAKFSAQQLASELQRRGWVVLEP